MFVIYPQKQEDVADFSNDIFTILTPKNAKSLDMVVVVETGTDFTSSKIAKKNAMQNGSQKTKSVFLRKTTRGIWTNTTMILDRKD